MNDFSLKDSRPGSPWAGMKTCVSVILLFSGFLGSGVMAEGLCATEQCEKARKIPNLPSDVRSFANQRDGCDHFRGEPWPPGDEPQARQRREFVLQNIRNLCAGTDERLAALRSKYRHDRAINEFLGGYEGRIETR